MWFTRHCVKTFELFRFRMLWHRYVLKTHFRCFTNQVNNLDDIERKQLFYRHKQYFEKIKGLIIGSRENL